MKMKTKAKRPKWAHKLKAKDWAHLKDVRFPQPPTLRGLREDAPSCRECAAILKRVDVND